MMNLSAMPFLLLAGAGLIWLALRRRPAGRRHEEVVELQGLSRTLAVTAPALQGAAVFV